MEEVKKKLRCLKVKILQSKEIPDNIKLELSNDVFKIEKTSATPDVIKQHKLLNSFLEFIEDSIDFLPCEPNVLIDEYFNSIQHNMDN